MNLVFCVLSLVTLGTIKPPVVKGQELSDDEIIEALALLLSETEDGRQDIRRGRQEFAGGQERPVFNLDLDDLELDRASEGRQLSRQDFEDALGTCTTTGYEVRLVVLAPTGAQEMLSSVQVCLELKIFTFSAQRAIKEHFEH